jgi:two-component system sensor histidine kinase KdpD
LTEENRPDPGLLLKKLQYEEKEKEKQTKGKLKIFLGYAAGSGKTYAMLEAAHEAKKHQVDVVAGYIEPHARPDTQAMAEGLEEIPPLMVDYKGIQLREFNLDAALERKPKLILVDELAHTNVRGSRNEKRYQDVRELLRAGINVYTTMNIQHLESLNDLVGNITNIEVKERVPDSVFDQADQVEVIDIEPEDLIERMKEGKIYGPVQAERALENFFRREKLVALREIALRRSADRVNRIAEEERNILGNTGYHTGEHILACISAAPSSAKVIRTAARLSYAFHAQFTALYVETPAMQEAGEKTKQTLKSHLELAKALGAKIVTVYGEDAAYQIAEYAIVSNVSKVVMGRTNHRGIWRRPRIEVMEKLTHMALNIDVYIIPDIRKATHKREVQIQRRRKTSWKNVFLDLAEITGVMAVATLAAYVLWLFRLPESNIIMIYILGILLSSYIANKKIYALYSSLISVFAFNFFFTEPYFSLKAYDKGYPTTFVMLFLVGLFTATLTRRLKQQSRESAKKAYRTEILLENSQKLRRCKSKQEVWTQVAGQAGKLLNLSLIIYPMEGSQMSDTPLLFPRKGMDMLHLKTCINRQELAVAQWVAANHHRAGACTHTLPDAKAMYLPIQDARDVKGVMGILLEERRPIQEFEYGLLIAMLNETGVKLQDTFLE